MKSVIKKCLLLINVTKTAKVAFAVPLAIVASLFFASELVMASEPVEVAEAIEDVPHTVEEAEEVSAEANENSEVAGESHAAEDEHGGHGAFGVLFLSLAVLLMAAKIGGVIEKIGQPAVLGELLAGIVLSAIGFAGVSFIDSIRVDQTIAFLAEIGAVILLFQIGLESNIRQLMKVGLNALLVAIIGVVVPFVAGTFIVGPFFFPDAPSIAHLFMGASMVATSVGITASCFKSMGILKTTPAQTVLGAAVIDDVLGLLVLAIVSAIATGGDVTPAFIARLSLEAFLFLGGAIVLGGFLAKPISDFFSKINTGTGMKLAIAFSFALVFAYAASLVGLAPIIGAFAAGLVLDAVHFNSFDAPIISSALSDLDINLSDKRTQTKQRLQKLIEHVNHTHIEDMIESLGMIFVPMFFAFTGLQIEIGSLLNPGIYLVAIGASIIAVIGKLVAGIVAKGTVNEKLLVGMSMVPRGEVGLIFASIGKGLGAINDAEFSAIVLMVIITTFISPPLIKSLSNKVAQESNKKNKTQAATA